MQINATLDDIRPIYCPQHPADPSRVAEIVARQQDGDIVREWDLPPVVVLDNEGNGYTVLDGHHRLEAASQLQERTIPAWVVSIADYCRLIETEFGGEMPHRLCDLREHILCGDVTANEVCEHGEAV